VEEHHSILYGPVNRLLIALLGEPPVERVAAVSPALAAFLFPDGAHAWIPDPALMALLLLLIFAILLPLLARRYSKESPSRVQTFLEMVVSFIRDLVGETIGHDPRGRYTAMLGSFFVFIAAANLFGLFFFLQPPTGALSTTVALALLSFYYFNKEGVREHGVLKYLKHFTGNFTGALVLMAILFFPIEIIGAFARILSLSLRLFMNIAGEHATTGVFTSLVPIVIPLPMMALGLFTALLQAYVFTLLSAVYVSLATAHEEH
jgi:F-type H+-transporting ATPase subunit a